MGEFSSRQGTLEAVDCSEISSVLVWLPDSFGVESPLLSVLDIRFEGNGSKNIPSLPAALTGDNPL
jgi:hypothetical protein